MLVNVYVREVILQHSRKGLNHAHLDKVREKKVLSERCFKR